MGGVFQPSTAAQYILILHNIYPFGVYQRMAICNNMDRKMSELMQRNNFYKKKKKVLKIQF